MPMPATLDWPAAHQEGRRWAEVFQLPLRRQQWKGQSGELAGTGGGASLDFLDHRPYLPGDDPRQISWQAYARTGYYLMKLYREEVRPLVDLTLDVSDSMFAFEAKGRRVLEVFSFALETARRAGAAVRVFVAQGAAFRHVADEAVASGHWWEEKELLPASGLHAALSLAAVPYRSGSLRVLVSDLLFPGESETVLLPLARQGRGVIFAPLCREETHPEWDGNYEFIEAESRGLFPLRVDAALRRRYEAAYARHFELWKAGAAKYGVLLARVPETATLGAALRAEALPVGAVEMT